MALAQYRLLGITDAKILYNNSGSVAEADLHFVNAVEMDPKEVTLEFEGDDQTIERFGLSGLSGTITMDTLDILNIAGTGGFGKTEQTGISGVASRVYWGDENEAAGILRGLKFRSKAEKISTGATVDLDIIVPRARIMALRPPSLNNKQKGQVQLRFSAERATTDIAGGALTGVPTNGAFYYTDERS